MQFFMNPIQKNTDAALSKQRRARLAILLSPGCLVVAAGVLVYIYARYKPDLNFGKQRLLVALLVGATLAAAGVVLHWKAVADQRRAGRRYWLTVLFTVVCVVLGPALAIVVADKLVGLTTSLSPAEPILVLRPSSSDSYQTKEFTFTATTNTLGMRDRDVDLQQKAGVRVLALGDSFTYGWGVDDALPWPRVVERRLAQEAHPVEILNFGCPGSGVDAYAHIAESVVPMAKPDVVLVAVLQGIDLKLADLGSTTNRLFQDKVEQDSQTSAPVVHRILPNFCEVVARRAAHTSRLKTAPETRQDWKAMTSWMTHRLTTQEARAFGTLDETVREMFFLGDLNPWEVYFALKYPDYVSFTLEAGRPEVERAVQTMATHLARIRQAAEQANARAVVISVPPAWYYNRHALVSKRRVGYRLDDSALLSDAPDSCIRRAAEAAGIEFWSFTPEFRRLNPDEKWYYDLDGMYNARGHQLLGEQVSKALLRLLD